MTKAERQAPHCRVQLPPPYSRPFSRIQFWDRTGTKQMTAMQDAPRSGDGSYANLHSEMPSHQKSDFLADRVGRQGE